MRKFAHEDIFKNCMFSPATLTIDLLMGKANLYFFERRWVSLSQLPSGMRASEPREVCFAEGISSVTARAARTATAQGT